MNKTILVDVGSSTLKVYEQSLDSVTLKWAKSIAFKTDFNPNIGISQSNMKELITTLVELRTKNPGVQIKLFATAIFRKLESKAKKDLIDKIFLDTGLYFNIISQDLENFYLQSALVGKYQSTEPVLLVNIGGGSTELVVIKDKVVIETKNVDMGVGTIISEFPNINNDKSGTNLEDVISFSLNKLPELANQPKTILYSGGELTFMQLSNYQLEENNLFTDKDHPSKISLTNFTSKNLELYNQITLKELEGLMPNNPTWMHGARSCSTLAQAICQKYGIETIIPSDSNLINGAARQEFRSVTISGSFRKHLEYILKVRKQLIDKNVEVLSPRFTEPENPGEEFVVFTGEAGLTPLELERHHLDSIDKSDALIVCNPQGYVGASSLIEIGYAQSINKEIIFTEKPEEFMLNTLPAEIGI